MRSLITGIVAAGVTSVSAHTHHSHSASHPAHNGHVHHSAPQTPAAVRFPLSAIAAAPDSDFAVAQARNTRWLLSLDDTKLTCHYTTAANITGTWAKPTCTDYDGQGYWGHFLGHYLSAAAITLQNNGDSGATGAAVAQKVSTLLDSLSAVQDAWAAIGEPGFLYPYSPTSFDNLLERAQNCAPVCVPFYVFHKMLAGLLDLSTRAGDARAGAMAEKMGAWVSARIACALAEGGQSQWQAALNTCVEHTRRPDTCPASSILTRIFAITTKQGVGGYERWTLQPLRRDGQCDLRKDGRTLQSLCVDSAARRAHRPAAGVPREHAHP